jgi:hypothetical protein
MSKKTSKKDIIENLKSDKLINFYELDEMQKFMPKINDEQVMYTGMPLHQHFLLVGGTGSGKTLSLLNYIAKTSLNAEGTYKHVLMCVKKLEAPNKYLKENLGDKITFYFRVEDFPLVSQFPDLSARNNANYLVIFDDCINDGKNSKMQKKIDEYFTYGRSKGITIAYLTQSFYQTPIFLRKQVSFILLCSIKRKSELKSIITDYDTTGINPETLANMYKYATNGPKPNFLKICTYECEPGKKYSKNFTEYLNPRDFYIPDGMKGDHMDVVDRDCFSPQASPMDDDGGEEPPSSMLYGDGIEEPTEKSTSLVVSSSEPKLKKAPKKAVVSKKQAKEREKSFFDNMDNYRKLIEMRRKKDKTNNYT